MSVIYDFKDIISSIFEFILSNFLILGKFCLILANYEGTVFFKSNWTYIICLNIAQFHNFFQIKPQNFPRLKTILLNFTTFFKKISTFSKTSRKIYKVSRKFARISQIFAKFKRKLNSTGNPCLARQLVGLALGAAHEYLLVAAAHLRTVQAKAQASIPVALSWRNQTSSYSHKWQYVTGIKPET